MDITITTRFLAVKDVTAKSTVLKGCLKVSRRIVQTLHETGEVRIEPDV